MEKNEETETLDDLFKFGFEAIKDLEQMDATDAKYAQTVAEAIEKLEQCTTFVNQLNLFSINEKVEEIATPVLKFLLLPAFLSTLATRKRDDRLLILEQSEIYLEDFLKRCTEYGLTSWTGRKSDDGEGNRSLEQAARDRNSKINRYKEGQRLESLLLEVEKKIEVGSAQDDEVRDYYLNLIQFWCNKAVDDLDLVEHEKQILKFMRSKPQETEEKEPVKRKPFKPFIITKSAEQKKVFGAGYPSLPILSVDEFYEQKYGKDGKGGAEGSGHCPGGHSLQKWAEDPEANERALDGEAAEKEDKVTNDDPDELARMRSWDDWKDEHRRGEGNRKNMG
ncbi:immunoglobulin-binding protein 1 [Galendromus occidentalis]|uniref:Immunoglobulin-binding protein 1 n=1 Tax=Galendromus occidentalis TaxID=34638 RepID=A0AAJ6VWD2_9ACAR|nr:immunoglobulin-binding protein 1 [Galendromus occidentalis]